MTAIQRGESRLSEASDLTKAASVMYSRYDPAQLRDMHITPAHAASASAGAGAGASAGVSSPTPARASSGAADGFTIGATSPRLHAASSSTAAGASATTYTRTKFMPMFRGDPYRTLPNVGVAYTGRLHMPHLFDTANTAPDAGPLTSVSGGPLHATAAPVAAYSSAAWFDLVDGYLLGTLTRDTVTAQVAALRALPSHERADPDARATAMAVAAGTAADADALRLGVLQAHRFRLDYWVRSRTGDELSARALALQRGGERGVQELYKRCDRLGSERDAAEDRSRAAAARAAMLAIGGYSDMVRNEEARLGTLSTQLTAVARQESDARARAKAAKEAAARAAAASGSGSAPRAVVIDSDVELVEGPFRGSTLQNGAGGGVVGAHLSGGKRPRPAGEQTAQPAASSVTAPGAVPISSGAGSSSSNSSKRAKAAEGDDAGASSHTGKRKMVVVIGTNGIPESAAKRGMPFHGRVIPADLLPALLQHVTTRFAKTLDVAVKEFAASPPFVVRYGTLESASKDAPSVRHMVVVAEAMTDRVALPKPGASRFQLLPQYAAYASMSPTEALSKLAAEPLVLEYEEVVRLRPAPGAPGAGSAGASGASVSGGVAAGDDDVEMLGTSSVPSATGKAANGTGKTAAKTTSAAGASSSGTSNKSGKAGKPGLAGSAAATIDTSDIIARLSAKLEVPPTAATITSATAASAGGAPVVKPVTAPVTTSSLASLGGGAKIRVPGKPTPPPASIASASAGVGGLSKAATGSSSAGSGSSSAGSAGAAAGGAKPTPKQRSVAMDHAAEAALQAIQAAQKSGSPAQAARKPHAKPAMPSATSSVSGGAAPANVGGAAVPSARISGPSLPALVAIGSGGMAGIGAKALAPPARAPVASAAAPPKAHAASAAGKSGAYDVMHATFARIQERTGFGPSLAAQGVRTIMRDVSLTPEQAQAVLLTAGVAGSPTKAKTFFECVTVPTAGGGWSILPELLPSSGR